MSKSRTSQMSIADLQSELAQRKSEMDTLTKQRREAAKTLKDLDRQIAKLEGRKRAVSTAKRKAKGQNKGSKRGRKPKGEGLTVADAVEQVMKGKEGMAVKDIAPKAQAVHGSTSKTFGSQVAQVLAKDERFERVERGVYKLVTKSVSQPKASKPKATEAPQSVPAAEAEPKAEVATA